MENQGSNGALVETLDHSHHVWEAEGAQADHVGQVVGLRGACGTAIEDLCTRQHLLQCQHCLACLRGIPCMHTNQ